MISKIQPVVTRSIDRKNIIRKEKMYDVLSYTAYLGFIVICYFDEGNLQFIL